MNVDTSHTHKIQEYLFLPISFKNRHSNLMIKDSQTLAITASHAQELQHGQSTSGGLPEQSVTKTPRSPGGLVLLRSAQTSSGIAPVKSFTLRNAIPV